MGKRRVPESIRERIGGRGLGDADLIWIGLLILSFMINAYVIYGLKSAVPPPRKPTHVHVPRVVKSAPPPPVTGCAPGTELVGDSCAEVGGKQGQEQEKDELGYPKP